MSFGWFEIICDCLIILSVIITNLMEFKLFKYCHVLICSSIIPALPLNVLSVIMFLSPSDFQGRSGPQFAGDGRLRHGHAVG